MQCDVMLAQGAIDSVHFRFDSIIMKCRDNERTVFMHYHYYHRRNRRVGTDGVRTKVLVERMHDATSFVSTAVIDDFEPRIRT